MVVIRPYFGQESVERAVWLVVEGEVQGAGCSLEDGNAERE
jgi:hypothetical protein